MDYNGDHDYRCWQKLYQNVFWTVQFSDPHQVLSWDHMHNYAHGLGGKHIWPEIQRHIEALGCEALKWVDDQ